jgi:hypothetical protein
MAGPEPFVSSPPIGDSLEPPRPHPPQTRGRHRLLERCEPPWSRRCRAARRRSRAAPFACRHAVADRLCAARIRPARTPSPSSRLATPPRRASSAARYARSPARTGGNPVTFPRGVVYDSAGAPSTANGVLANDKTRTRTHH